MGKIDDLREEGIVLSTEAFVLTKKTLILPDNTLLNLSDIAIVGIQDTRSKAHIGRWIAIAVVSIAIFVYDRIRKGHVDETDLFLVPLIVAVFVYVVTLNFGQTKLIIKMASGEEHTVEDGSVEELYYWRGILSATGVDWMRDAVEE